MIILQMPRMFMFYCLLVCAKCLLPSFHNTLNLNRLSMKVVKFDEPLTIEWVINSDHLDFAHRIKQLAAKQPNIQIQLQDGISIIESLTQYLTTKEYRNDRSLSLSKLSDCIWAISKLKIPLNSKDKLFLRETVSQICSNSIGVDTEENKLSVLRLVSGLAKLGWLWDHDFPDATKELLIHVTSDSTTGRELATLLYALGQCNASLSVTYSTQLLSSFQYSIEVDSLTVQGLLACLHGLGRLDFRWTDMSSHLTNLVISKATNISSPPDISSLLQSMALLKCDWLLLPVSFTQRLTDLLVLSTSKERNYQNREVANSLWSLGKMNADNQSVVLGLISQIGDNNGDLGAFDFESCLVGLGLAKTPWSSLPLNIQHKLLSSLDHQLDSMNIFNLHNAVWGLARMNVSRETLSGINIVETIVFNLHTFLPTHYGDLLWSLGTIGYNRRNDFTAMMSDRLLAVVSRVFHGLHVRAAAFSLWGLGRMGYRWTHFLTPTRSLAGGREAPPLQENVLKYLKQRVSGMKEQEFSVLLYSLGVLLQVDWRLNLPENVSTKIDHRISRVSRFFTSRSLSQALLGAASMNIGPSMSDEARSAWAMALSNRTQGLNCMNAIEYAQAIYSIGKLGYSYSSMTLPLQNAIERNLNIVNSHDNNSLIVYYVISGLLDLGFPLHLIPSNLVNSVRQLLLSPMISSFVDQHIFIDSSLEVDEVLNYQHDTDLGDGLLAAEVEGSDVSISNSIEANNFRVFLSLISKLKLHLVDIERNTVIDKLSNYLIEDKMDFPTLVDCLDSISFMDNFQWSKLPNSFRNQIANFLKSYVSINDQVITNKLAAALNRLGANKK